MVEDQTTSGWQVEGDSASAYERYMVPKLFAPWAKDLLDTVGVGRGDSVLDVACGTGVVARKAASRVGKGGSVMGVDLNPDMLKTAERMAHEERLAVTWKQGDALDLSTEEGAFDVVLCQQGLQFFPDPAASMDEMRRSLEPGGRLGLSVLRSLDHNRAYGFLSKALQEHVSDEAASMMRSPFEGPEAESLRELAAEAGFRDVSLTIHRSTARYPSPAELLRQEAASSPLAGPVGGIDDGVQEALVEAVAGDLAWCMDDEGVAVPLVTHVLTARG